MMRMVIGRTIGLPGIALCCCLISVPRQCVAQTQSAAVTLPNFQAIAPVPSTDSADLPSAPEPSDQIAQTGGTGQTTGTGQQQPNKPNQQDQTKPGNPPSLGDLGFTPQQTH